MTPFDAQFTGVGEEPQTPATQTQTQTPFDDVDTSAGFVQTANGAGDGSSSATAASIDINSLDSFNDVEEIDPNASITDAIPPPPAGIHCVRLRPLKDGMKEGKRVGAFDDNSVGFFEYPQGKRHLMIAIEIEVVDDGKPWNKQTIRDYANTMLDEGRGTTAVDTYLRILTGSAGVGLTTGQKVQKLHSVLQTEPTVKADLDWEATCVESSKKTKRDGTEKDVYRVALRGMKNFPENRASASGHSPLTEDPKTGEEVRTRYFVRQLFPLSYGGR